MNKYLKIPKFCPICNGETEVKTSDGGVKILYCANPNCEGKLSKKIEHYCDRVKGMDIRGLSLKTIERLIDEGWLNSIYDLYFLKDHKIEWANKNGFGIKSVSNILNSIEESKNCVLEAFISSLGIPLVGKNISKEIVKYYSTWNDFRSAIPGRWSDLEGFGPELERNINKFDYTEADKIAEMLAFKHPESASKEISNGAAAGKTFVITGKLSKGRDLIKADIESFGGKVTGSVSSKTNYLVCNNKNSTTGKSADAKKLNIPIITEEELMEMLK